jgi:hypothetical protein
MADALAGTIRIVSLSEPTKWSRYQTCTMDLLVNAPGIVDEPLETEVVLDKRYWPTAGMVLRARISRTTPRMIDVNWDALSQPRAQHPTPAATDLAEVAPSTADASALVSHIVLLRWSPDADDATRNEVRRRLHALPGLIDGIVGFTDGPSTSPEGLERGYDYGFIVMFADAAARDAYVPHPEHLPVAALVGAAAADLVVFDI